MSLFCRLGWHRWAKPRRLAGFLRRRCLGCPAKQNQEFPGGGWKTVVPVKRHRKPKVVHMVTTIEEQALDQARGLEPL